MHACMQNLKAALAAEMARKVALTAASAASSGISDNKGAALLLAGRGLRSVPHEVWGAGPSLVKLDLSNNPVSHTAGTPHTARPYTRVAHRPPVHTHAYR